MKPISFDNRYQRLGEPFSVATRPEPVKEPQLIIFNYALAAELGLHETMLDGAKNETACTAILSGNEVPCDAEPIAMAYAGHQFGHFNPQLGDGRAILLAEFDAPDNTHYELQLKGSGHTRFSRDGDGRAALGPVLREYLLSEAMAKLGIPTTRALAAVTTGELVARAQLLPGGIITRLSNSFVRIGTFQYFAANDNMDAVKALADHMIDNNYPSVKTDENRYRSLLSSIVKRQSKLIAGWMQVGFIHGVMNTDNMSIAGETIDYGPCAFMDHFDFNQVYSSIDRHGRYAYNNQPSIALWNLTRLAETFLPLLSEDSDTAVDIAQNILQHFVSSYEKYWLDGMREKIGLMNAEDQDKSLIEDLLNIMNSNRADFTLTFYYLSATVFTEQPEDEIVNEQKFLSLFENTEAIKLWLKKWHLRLQSESFDDRTRQKRMYAVNPVYIPRNHQIEAAIRAAEDNDDFSVFHALHEVLQRPYELQPGKERYMLPPESDEIVHQTFCGT